MNTVKSLLCASCALICFLAGCAGPTQYETVEQICVPAVGSKDAMQIAENVLSRMHFTIAKTDTESGYIKTRPLPAGQFFEFWRSDTVGPFNSAEANIHTIRRIVELNITEQKGQVCVGCDVKVQRLSLSEYKAGDGSQKYDRLSGLRARASIQELRLDAAQKAWLDLGRDEKLATVILKQIEEQIGKLKDQL